MNLKQFPFSLLLVFGVIYVGYDYYTFKNDEASPLLTKQRELSGIQVEVDKLSRRFQEVEEFRKGLDVKRLELRKLAVELQSTRATLSENPDVAGFMKTVVSEAQRAGLTVTSLKPGEVTKLEYVMQQAYDMSFTGVYVQLLGFLDRLSKLQKIVRAENYRLKPAAKSDSRFILLDGNIQLKTYRYLGTKADELVKDSPATTSNSSPQAAATGAPAVKRGGE